MTCLASNRAASPFRPIVVLTTVFMMAAVPALLSGFVAVVVVRRFFSYIRREPTHPRRRFTQLVREAERLLLEDLDDVDVGKGDGGGGADQLLTEEHLGCLCYLVQVLFMAFMASMRARARGWEPAGEGQTA